MYLCYIILVNPFSAEEMDKKDDEMREVIQRLWSVQAKKLIDLLVPPKEGKRINYRFSCWNRAVSKLLADQLQVVILISLKMS